MLFTFFVQAKIWTVDNSPGAGSDFKTAATAHAGASKGDTIIFMPSYGSYGSLNITKKLFIYTRCLLYTSRCV